MGVTIYNNYVYGLDIETSTIDSNTEKDTQISYMISFCVSRLNFFTGKYEEIYLGRTYDDLDKFLYNLNTKVKSDTIIYIHNFDYEYSFFKNNLRFFREYYNKNDERSYLFMSQNSPLYMKLDKLNFRCSLKLLHKSIKVLGDELNIPKLDYEYTKIRTPYTPLDKTEIEYNYRDVEIMLKSVYKIYKENKFITSIDKIPLTKTGISRLNCEKNKEVNKNVKGNKKQYKNKNGKKVSNGYRVRTSYSIHTQKCNDQKAETEFQLRLWEKCFQGGLVFSNPAYCGVVCNDVASIDFSSSYPTQMLYRYFPYDFKEVKENKLEAVKKYIRYEFNRPLKLIQSRPFYTFFNTTIILNNVNAKYFFYPLSISKIENFDELYNGVNCKFLNGKLLYSKVPIVITMTSLDLYILYLFYDYDVVGCDYLEVTRKTERSSDYMLNAVIYNGTKKLEYKTYNNKIQDTLKYKTYNKDEIEDEYFREQVNKQKDYIEQKNISHSMLQMVKSDLNSLYGINAMHLLHDRYMYDDDEMEWYNNPDTFESYLNKRTKTSYLYGMYIANYARSSLCYVIYNLLQQGINVLYSDTDSVKYVDNKLADKFINDFNDTITKSIEEKYRFLKFGVLDKEHIYDSFCTIGTKSYVTEMNGNIDATISGVPNATRIFQRLYDENYNSNFKDLVFNCYHYDCTIDKSCIKKLAHTYKNVKEYVEVYDNEADKIYREEIVSGCILKDTSVQMKSFESKIWEMYGRIIPNTYDTVDRLMFEIRTKITYDKKVDKYIVKTELKNDSIL